ncbi:MAG: hypothetical protein JNK04_13725 [Myxococcales bacterium]|nr:hypothetical protein [Myxococcales bacterium]
MNAELAQKSSATRAPNPLEQEWSIDDRREELEVEIDEDDDLYSNMPFTD